MHDDEWFSLVKRYQAAVWEFNEAVNRLSGASFQSAWEDSERARKQMEVARTALFDYEHNRGSVVNAAAGPEPLTFDETEELVLGDQGQSGG